MASMLLISLIFIISLLQYSIGTLQPTFVSSFPSCSQVTPTVPFSGGGTQLPSTNLSLQYVALARGTQNYTCLASDTVPIQLGAEASLFDATELAYDNETVLNTLPAVIVYIPLWHSVFPFDGMVLLGYHFFDSSGTPTFNLTDVNKILYGTKTGDIKAPATANRGPWGTGAVDWLQLESKAGYPSVGLSLVYRVETAGGMPPITCAQRGHLTVPYAAIYMFYD